MASAGPAKVLSCAASVATLEGSASGGNGSLGYAYRWEPAGDVSDPDVAQPTTTLPGSYTLTVTDLANGCTDVSIVPVSSDFAEPAAAASADDELDCLTLSVTLEATASGGNGSAGYAYAWEPAGDVSDPTDRDADDLGARKLLGHHDRPRQRMHEHRLRGHRSTTWPQRRQEPSALDLRPADPPLTVGWDSPVLRGDLRVEWQDVGDAAEHRLLRGNLDALRATGYDHAPLACGLAAVTHAFPPAMGSAYYLATAASCDGVEAPLGRDSLGGMRPDSAAASGLSCP